MLRLVAGTVFLFLMGFAEALAVEETRKDNIGPWEIEATFKDNKFDHCAISRKVDEVVASFLRTSDGLSLTLQSPNWKLERGKNWQALRAGIPTWLQKLTLFRCPFRTKNLKKDFVQPVWLSSRVPAQRSEFLWIRVARRSTDWITV